MFAANSSNSFLYSKANSVPNKNSIMVKSLHGKTESINHCLITAGLFWRTLWYMAINIHICFIKFSVLVFLLFENKP